MHVEFWLEEESTKLALDQLLPRLFDGQANTFETFNYRNREQLLEKLPGLLRDAAARMRAWPALRVVVLLDRDQKDCRAEKRQLEALSRAAGLPTKTAPAADGRFWVVNRLACEELEAWYFGDRDVITQVYPRVRAQHYEGIAPDPDAISGGTWEAFQRLLARAGYPDTRLKREWAARIGPHLDPARNQSASFRCFWQGVQALLA